MVQVPSGEALITVELHITDKNLAFALGGKPERAGAFASQLAAELGIPYDADDVLVLHLDHDFVDERILPVLKQYSDLGWTPLENKKHARPAPVRANRKQRRAAHVKSGKDDL